MRLVLALTALATLACTVPSQLTGPTDEPGEPKPGGAISVRITNDPHDFDLSYNGKSRPMNDMQSQLNASLLGFKAGPNFVDSWIEK